MERALSSILFMVTNVSIISQDSGARQTALFPSSFICHARKLAPVTPCTAKLLRKFLSTKKNEILKSTSAERAAIARTLHGLNLNGLAAMECFQQARSLRNRTDTGERMEEKKKLFPPLLWREKYFWRQCHSENYNSASEGLVRRIGSYPKAVLFFVDLSDQESNSFGRICPLAADFPMKSVTLCCATLLLAALPHCTTSAKSGMELIRVR
jgi:hypothetical protein